MNVTDMAKISLFPAELEALKAVLNASQDVSNAIMAAEETGEIEDTVEISDIAQKLFSSEV